MSAIKTIVTHVRATNPRKRRRDPQRPRRPRRRRTDTDLNDLALDAELARRLNDASARIKARHACELPCVR